MASKGTRILSPFNYSGVQLADSNFLHQFKRMKHYFLGIPNDEILKGFRERAKLPSPGKGLGGWYSVDMPLPLIFKKKPSTLCNTFGQWLGAFARMYKVTGDSQVLMKLDQLLTEWGKTIEKDGCFFYGSNPAIVHYDYDKTIGGLADIYEYVGDEKAIHYAGIITDWAEKNLRRRRTPATPDCSAGGTWVGGEESDIEWYTLPENLYRLYLLTGDPKYRDFAEVWHYNSYWRALARGDAHCMTGLHAYSHVNTLCSAAMAYEVTGESAYLDVLMNAYTIMHETQMFATGGYGPGEKLANPNGSLGDSLQLQAETFECPCGCWAGFKLSRYLMMYTGKAIYGDWIERLLYNGIGAALPMGEGGRTFYYSDYCVGGGTKRYFHDSRLPSDPPSSFTPWPCCSGTYPLAITDYHNIIYFFDDSSLYVNLFVPSQVEWMKGTKRITVVQDTSFPSANRVTLKVGVSEPSVFSLKFRIPDWAHKDIRVEVNQSAFPGRWQHSNWGEIGRTWKQGDQVSIEVPLDLHLSNVDKYHVNLAALMYGPIVLVSNRRLQSMSGRKLVTSLRPTSREDLTFSVQADAEGLQFKPYFAVDEDELYYMYHEFSSKQDTVDGRKIVQALNNKL